jgi:hypothetical protein
VRWEGYGLEDDSWEPLSGLGKARGAIRDFEAQG